jgi:hypothetical protein
MPLDTNASASGLTVFISLHKANKLTGRADDILVVESISQLHKAQKSWFYDTHRTRQQQQGTDNTDL